VRHGSPIRDRGLEIGVLSPGPLNAITDVTRVRVGHFTLQQGTRFNTGITAVLPHGGNLFQEKVPAATVVGNGFGKLLGSTQVNEVGAGAGTVCFGFKGGIGSASRRLEAEQGGWTVGVLVQSNFGGPLRIDGLRMEPP